MGAQRRKYHANKVATIVGPGTSFDGVIRSKGSIRIEGSVTGRVQCDDTIVVHRSGVVKADLEAGQIIVSGTVEGDCIASDRIEITSSGIVRGNITAPRVAIAEGVVFEGHCTMNPDTEDSSHAAPSKQSPSAAPLPRVAHPGS